MSLMILIRGGGDLASGAVLRLHRAGLRVIITELAQPLSVRRLVSFSEAIYQGHITIEGITARRVVDLTSALVVLSNEEVPVLVDPQAVALSALREFLPPSAPVVLIDARMTKQPPVMRLYSADLVIGLGPGFIAGQNCHAVVETNRGHRLGRVIWQGAPEMDTGVPDNVVGRSVERVLRAPVDGLLVAHVQIGDHLLPGQLVAEVDSQPINSPFAGVLRGLLHPGLQVKRGMKIGDVDPRDDPRYCTLVSDKSLAVGGGVLEAILSRQEIRPFLWD